MNGITHNLHPGVAKHNANNKIIWCLCNTYRSFFVFFLRYCIDAASLSLLVSDQNSTIWIIQLTGSMDKGFHTHTGTTAQLDSTNTPPSKLWVSWTHKHGHTHNVTLTPSDKVTFNVEKGGSPGAVNLRGIPCLSANKDVDLKVDTSTFLSGTGGLERW